MGAGEGTFEVVLPQLGESVAEGTVLRWLKKPGDRVEADEDLVEISTDKVDTEIPSPDAGRLAEILVAEGETVEVGAVLARLTREAEASEAGTGGASGAGGQEATERAGREPSVEQEEPLHFEASTIDLFSAGGAGSSEKRTTAPEQESADRGSAAAERPTEAGAPPLRATPAVRKLARERGVELSDVRGSGPGGRVTRADLLARLEGERARPAGGAAQGKVEELSPVRRVIARRMVESRQTIPHVTTVVEADLTVVSGLRNRFRTAFEESRGVPLTYLPFILSAVLDALSAHPVFNAHFREDAIRVHEAVHLGLAVATDRGLLVPVLRDADRLSFAELAERAVALAARARDGELTPDEVQGGTFTVTNHGRGGSLLGTPIIVPPQTAILGLGRIGDVPSVVDGEITIRKKCYLSLSFDHRAADGAQADAFLMDVARRLASFAASEVRAAGRSDRRSTR